MKTKHRCHAVKGDMRRESVGFKGVINVFTVVLSAPRTGYRQRHSAQGGGREIQMIPNTWRDTSLTTEGYSAVVKQSNGCKLKWFVYSDSSSCKCNRPLCHLPSNNTVCLAKSFSLKVKLILKEVVREDLNEGKLLEHCRCLEGSCSFFWWSFRRFT